MRVYTNRLATEAWDITSYEYDLPLDQPTRVDLPGETEPVHVYEYNSRGLKTKEDVGRPEEIRWIYDAAGRVKRIEYPNGTSVNYTYSGNGESYVTTAELLENGTLWKVETRKNLRGWVTLEAWEIDGVRYEIRYTYDDAGNRTSMTYPDGTTVRFEYNERNQLVRIPGFFEGPAAGVWTDNAGFRYDVNGFLIGMRAVNGIETTFQPDERNRLKQISSSPLTLTYAYTPGGNVVSITDASYGEPFTTTYGYDGANRLILAQVHMPTGIETVQYVYDALDNRIKEAWTDARGAIDYSYLPGNYLVRRGSTSYSWGTYGQLILKDDQPNALGGETNYDYNARRLMTQVRVNGSPVAQFFYDPYGRRVKIVEGDTTTITLYSGNDIVYEVKTKPGQPTVTTKYLAINGKYLAKVVQEGTNPPQSYFYHTDLVGSVRAITDSQGQVVARFEYEPFGVTVQASGPLAGSEVHKFTGKPEDAAIDLYYFNARYYDPTVGRFTSPDPANQTLNRFEYALWNPLRYVDPDGREAGAGLLSLEAAYSAAHLTRSTPWPVDDAVLWGAAGAATGIGLLLVTLDRPADRAIAQAQAEVDEARNKDWYIQVVHFTTEEAASAIKRSGVLVPGSSGVIYVTMPQFVSGMRREEIADRLGIPYNKTEHYFLFYVRASEIDGPVVPAAPFGDSKGGYPELHIREPIALWRDKWRFTQDRALLMGETFVPPLLPPPVW